MGPNKCKQCLFFRPKKVEKIKNASKCLFSGIGRPVFIKMFFLIGEMNLNSVPGALIGISETSARNLKGRFCETPLLYKKKERFTSFLFGKERLLSVAIERCY